MLALAFFALALTATPDGYVFVKGHDTYVEDRSLDFPRVSALRDKYGPDFFYFRANGADYIVTDRATLKQIDALFEPQRELGRKQADLGDKQAALGSKQAELGARQAQIGAAQGATNDSRTQERLSKNQEELSRRQETLSREQQSLSEIQSDLGAKQEEFGRAIREKLGSLTKEWIRSGLAKPLR
jgi:hypothetical protein